MRLSVVATGTLRTRGRRCELDSLVPLVFHGEKTNTDASTAYMSVQFKAITVNNCTRMMLRCTARRSLTRLPRHCQLFSSQTVMHVTAPPDPEPINLGDVPPGEEEMATGYGIIHLTSISRIRSSHIFAMDGQDATVTVILPSQGEIRHPIVHRLLMVQVLSSRCMWI